MFNGSKKDRDREIRENDGHNMFTGGVYHGSKEAIFTTAVADMEISAIVRLVQERAKKDGQWCIDMDLVGPNEDKMRRMIMYCSDEIKIMDKVHYITHHDDPALRTVDFVCRDIANASKWSIK
jgi:hypothetical protein